MAKGSQRASRGRGEGEAGYNMVALVIIILLMNVAVAMVLPTWSTVIQREKEEELIFRGLQYAEAIRVFQQRHGRLPVKLEELIKVEPRSIRQLWDDPITNSSDWGIVLAAGPNQTASQGGRNGRDRRRRDKGDPGDPAGDIGLPGSSDPNLPKGPIVGVFSRSTEASVKVFFDQQRYSDWKFTLPLITASGGKGQGAGAQSGVSSGHVGQVARRANSGGAPRLGIKWLGRPFRQGVQPVGQAGAGGTGLPPSSMTTSPAGGNPRNNQNAGQNQGRDLAPAGNRPN